MLHEEKSVTAAVAAAAAAAAAALLMATRTTLTTMVLIVLMVLVAKNWRLSTWSAKHHRTRWAAQPDLVRKPGQAYTQHLTCPARKFCCLPNKVRSIVALLINRHTRIHKLPRRRNAKCSCLKLFRDAGDTDRQRAARLPWLLGTSQTSPPASLLLLDLQQCFQYHRTTMTFLNYCLSLPGGYILKSKEEAVVPTQVCS